MNKEIEKETNTQNTKNQAKIGIFLQKLSLHSNAILVVTGVLALIYPIINTFYNKIYQGDCEAFYNIPRKYFSSSIDSNLLYIMCVAILLAIYLSPAIMRKNAEKKGTNSTGLSVYTMVIAVIIGLQFSLFNVFNLIEIMEQVEETDSFAGCLVMALNNKANLTIAIVVGMGIIALTGLTFIYVVRKIKKKNLRIVMGAIWAISVIGTIFILIFGTCCNLSIDIEDKTKYEFLKTNDAEYVVLSEYEDKNLVVEYDIDDDGQYLFLTKEYMLIDKQEGSYTYVSLDKAPKIE